MTALQPNHSAAPVIPLGVRREQRDRARHLRVAKVVRRQRRTRALVWGSAALTALALFTLVAFHVFAVQHAFSLDHLREDRAEEELRYERLRAEVASLSAPESVVAAARELGMVPAQSVDFIDAPAAAPLGDDDGDPTDDTLAGTHSEAKARRGP
jgi:hypothetical protein